MPDLKLRHMEKEDWAEVADLICVSTNYWYQTHGKPPVFTGGAASTMLFCRVYEDLDPGCCILAEDPATGRIGGSCFYHPRETHVSLGIMNVHPNYFGAGIARRLLDFIIAFAEKEEKSVRLVSSAINLDSFSLYSRAGFVPRLAFQDMFVQVPENGLGSGEGATRVRDATPDDVEAIVALECELSHIRREKDYRYFIENREGIWHVSVYENDEGRIDGFLASVRDPGSNMLGPGAARDEGVACELITAGLDRFRGGCPVFLVPVQCAALVARMYSLGARNCEMHFAQVRGAFEGFDGVIMPTFMPETA